MRLRSHRSPPKAAVNDCDFSSFLTLPRLPPMNWLTWSLLSAVFAALTAILAKIGIAGVDSNLATAVRTVVILAAIFLREKITVQVAVGTVLMTVGALVIAWPRN